MRVFVVLNSDSSVRGVVNDLNFANNWFEHSGRVFMGELNTSANDSEPDESCVHYVGSPEPRWQEVTKNDVTYAGDGMFDLV